MAGPYTGTWRAAAVSNTAYSGASKWGTGINPVHGIRTSGPNIITPSKVNIDPVAPPGGQDTDIIAEDYAWDGGVNQSGDELENYNVTPISLYGYNSETGTADRPFFDDIQSDRYSNEMGWGLPNPPYDAMPVPDDPRGRMQNFTSNDFPSWGGSRKTKPAGTLIRSLRRGARLISSAKVLPNEDVAQGWINKGHGISPDSHDSDVSTVLIQTSAVQRRKVRAGSQRSGSQSTFEAPIASRETGQKLKVYAASDSDRHWDMLPYQQEDYVRPFLSRTVGTGWREWNLPNAMYVSPTIQREPAPDPQLGPVAGSGTDNYAYDFTDGYSGGGY